MYKNLLIILVTALFLSGSAFAQKYNFKTYTVNDGLPSNHVYDILLDDSHFAWFATSYGLVAFDGVDFIKYGREHGLLDEIIYDIFIDSQDRFFISTETGGVAEMKKGNITYPDYFDALDSTLILYMNESPYSNEIWFGSYEKGIFIWDGSRFDMIDTSDGLPDNRVWDIKFLNESETWIGTRNGLAIHEKGKGITKIVSDFEELSDAAVFEIFKASDETIWLATSEGVVTFKNGKFKSIPTINGKRVTDIASITEDEEGTIWIGTARKGIFWYDESEFTQITRDNGLSSNYIYRFYREDDGTIWAATEGNGVSILRDKQFAIYDEDSDYGQLSSYSLFVDDKGVLWSGNEKGLTKIENGKFHQYSYPAEFENAGEISNIEQLPNGNFLLLTYNYYLLEFDGSHYSFSDYDKLNEEYFIMDFVVDDDSTIWFAGFQEILKAKNGETEYIRAAGPEWEHIHMLYKDSKGRIWAGTERGVANVKKDSQFYTVADGLAGGEVYDITEDDYGNLWVGTDMGVSFLHIDGSEAEIENFKGEDIFQQETILLIHGKNGELWQGTYSGLNYFNTEKWYSEGAMEVINYSLQETGSGMVFNDRAAVFDEKSQLWFGTPEYGIINFDNSQNALISEFEPPLTYIRRLQVNSTVAYDSFTKSEEELVFEHNKNNIEIEFRTEHFKAPQKIFYRYKLKGFDEEWQQSYGDPKVSYTNLEPGDYTFSVMAKSSQSGWPETSADLSFTIKNPYWLSAWFIALMVILAISVAGAGFKFVLNLAEKRKLRQLVDEQTEHLSKALQEKEMLIKEIHHRVKNNLAVVSGLLDLQSWRMEDNEARHALEDSKLRIRAMAAIHEKLYQNTDLTQINFKEFVEELIEEVSSSLKGTDKNITVTKDIEVKFLGINDAIPCALILNELISNAYEHAFNETKSGTIYITFREDKNHYKLHLKDNGCGIPDEMLNGERNTLGLTLVNSLSAQLSGDLNMYSDNGTVVELTFPKK